ncbi:MAG: hypothetical protein H0W99_12795, partial [Acidobacteria bacterium]|nr:hypothetical protein [Acidobacteriota bacterium]
PWDGKSSGEFKALAILGEAWGETADDFVSTQEQVARYAEREGLTIAKAREQLWGKRKKAIKIEFNDRVKAEAARISKVDKKRLRIPERGRPEGSKGQLVRISKAEFYANLRRIIERSEQQGEDLTLKQAAAQLNLGYAKKLRRMLDGFGEKRNWRTLRKEMSRDEEE